MRTENVCALFMMIALISFLGFVVENLWLAVTKGYMDNRNMIFPFLIGYGVAVFVIYLLFGTPEELCIVGNVVVLNNKVLSYGLYFGSVMVCISVGEIVLGKVVEKTCHFYWWDYSRLPFHITRYTSIPTSAGFSVIIVLFMGKVFIPVYEWFLSWNQRWLAFTSIALMTIMLVDYLHGIFYMYKNKGIQRRWRRDIPSKRMSGCPAREGEGAV